VAEWSKAAVLKTVAIGNHEVWGRAPKALRERKLHSPASRCRHSASREQRGRGRTWEGGKWRWFGSNSV